MDTTAEIQLKIIEVSKLELLNLIMRYYVVNFRKLLIQRRIMAGYKRKGSKYKFIYTRYSIFFNVTLSFVLNT